MKELFADNVPSVLSMGGRWWIWYDWRRIYRMTCQRERWTNYVLWRWICEHSLPPSHLPSESAAQWRSVSGEWKLIIHIVFSWMFSTISGNLPSFEESWWTCNICTHKYLFNPPKRKHHINTTKCNTELNMLLSRWYTQRKFYFRSIAGFFLFS